MSVITPATVTMFEDAIAIERMASVAITKHELVTNDSRHEVAPKWGRHYQEAHIPAPPAKMRVIIPMQVN